jgi:hypothetical protein
MKVPPRLTPHLLLLLLFAAAGFAIVMRLTAPRGPGVSTDAVQYIAAGDPTEPSLGWRPSLPTRCYWVRPRGASTGAEQLDGDDLDWLH